MQILKFYSTLKINLEIALENSKKVNELVLRVIL